MRRTHFCVLAMASVLAHSLSPELDLDAPDAPPGTLLLPGRRFPLNFAAGEFTVHGHPLIVLETQNSGEGTGHTVWDGAVMLAKHLEARYPSLAGKRVLEVGCGPGLAGMTAAALGADEVILTDLPYALENVRAAVTRNALAFRGGRVTVGVLDWLRPDTCDIAGVRDADLIVASDVVWVSELIEPLVATLAHLSAPSARTAGAPPPTVLIAHQTRSTSGDAAFFAALARSGFLVAEVPREEHHPAFSGGDVIRILEVRLKGSGGAAGGGAARSVPRDF